MVLEVYDSSLAVKRLWYEIAVFTVGPANFPVERVFASHRSLKATLSVPGVDVSVSDVATSLCCSESIITRQEWYSTSLVTLTL